MELVPPTSRPRMKLPVDLPQPVAGDVRVNLRRADIRVAEQFLDDTQIRAMLQQMRREAVPQHVRRDIALNSGAPDAIFDVQPKCNGRKWRAEFRQKNICRRFWCDEF